MTLRSPFSTPFRLAPGLLLGLWLAGCGEAPDASHSATEARSLLSAGHAASAVQAVKVAVAAQPDAPEPRLLLGQALLAAGDGVAAEVEISRAQSLGASADDALPLLAEALLAQRKFEPLLALMREPPLPARADARASVWRHQAEALAIRGERAEARKRLALALEAQPAHVGARLLDARLLAADEALQPALARMDALLGEVNDQPDLWLFKAELLARLRAPDSQRQAALERALALRTDLVPAHAGLISLALERGDLALAGRRHQTLAQLQPHHASTLYFEAVLAEHAGDGARVRGLAQELVRRLPEDTAILMLAGRAAMEAGAYGQGISLLARAARLAPRNAEPSRLLAQAQLRTGWPDKALAALRPFIGEAARDADALLLAARAMRLKGDAPNAEALARRALALRPDDGRWRLTVALWMSGRLREAIASDPLDGGSAELEAGGLPGLVRLQLAARDLAGARRTLDALERAQPGVAGWQILRARLALAEGQRATARQRLEQARERDPAHPAAVALLARLDLDEGRPDAAMVRLDSLLAVSPRNLDARLAKVQVMRQRGAEPAQVQAVLAEAVRLHPQDPKAHLALIDALAADQRGDAMLVAAKAATAAVPDHVDLMDRLGRAHLMQRELLQAETTFKRLAALMDRRAYPYVRVAEAQLGRAQFDSARESLRVARQFEPDDIEALRASVAMALRDGRVDNARALAQEARQRWPQLPLAAALLADIAASTQRWAEAISAYREALARQPGSAELTQRLHDALLADGQAEAAAQTLANWQRAHPDDPTLLQHLASASLGRRDWPNAERLYRQLLGQRPDDLLVLNNLAMALLRQRKPEALTLAEKALARAPQHPAVIDTAARAHGEAGQWARAIELQRRAVSLQPLDRGLLLNLASLQFRAGELEAARESFVQLTRIGLGTPLGAEAEQLRQQLGLPAGGALQGNEAWQASAPSAGATPAGGPTGWLARAETAAAAVLALGLLGGLALLLRAARHPPFVLVRQTLPLAAPPERVRALLGDLRQWPTWSTLPGLADDRAPRFDAVANSTASKRCEWPARGALPGGTLELLPALEAGHVLAERIDEGTQGLRQLWDFAPQPDGAGGTLLTCTVREPAHFGRHLRLMFSGHLRRLSSQLQADLARLQALSSHGEQGHENA
ncbi:XrtA/PEP-CTERM system TPR-repeat protein PrsT [Ideonella sp. DXS22W]|uniref:XrtA/PEP-CTERM system TPR-repeat protein PrsT n=1 Tax=Pseudaquabacterium inlustre TaxID=2984192 RepID=A0ABU9CIB9_9BURK